MNKRVKKTVLSTLAVATFGSYVAPSVSAVKASAQVESSDDIELGNLENELYQVIQQDLDNRETISSVQPRSISVGLLATLATKYGIVYLKTTLPKLIYGKIAGVIGGVISQSKFVSIFGKAVNAGSTYAFKSQIVSGLTAAGVPEDRAETIVNAVVKTIGILS